jgi:threonine/homoserine/homoserine lactone efflux protein
MWRYFIILNALMYRYGDANVHEINVSVKYFFRKGKKSDSFAPRMVLQGFLLGLTLSIAVGPLLFSLVQAGLESGFRSAMLLALGIWLSDLGFVLLLRYAYTSFSAWVQHPVFQTWAGVVGGLLLLAFGLASLLKHRSLKQELEGKKMLSKSNNGVTYFLSGFVLNTFNPGTLFFWVSVGVGMMIPGAWTDREAFVFFGTMLLTLAVTDVLKAYGAQRLREWLTPVHIGRLKVIIGLILTGIGAVLLLRAVWNWS